MRILTFSKDVEKGLISISEAEDYMPQIVIFCIPVDFREVKHLTKIDDFQRYFSRGIYTNIQENGRSFTTNLDYEGPIRIKKNELSSPKFAANISGFKIDFFLSSLNYSNDNQEFSIDYYYSGRLLRELSDKRLIILEPNWDQLDNLYNERRIIFTD